MLRYVTRNNLGEGIRFGELNWICAYFSA